MNPPVEILLATHNGAQYLGELIDSLLAQTYEPILITIRDDASTDKTRNIIDIFQNVQPDKFRVYFNNKPTEGPMANFSNLISLSCAPYMMLCDQDDVWLPDKVEKTLQRFLELEKRFDSQTPMLIFTDLTVVNDRLATIHPSFWKYAGLKPNNLSFSRLLVQNVVTGCTVFFNRSLAEISTPIPGDTLMHDWWLALVASAFGQVGFLNQSTVLYRQHKSNILGAQRWARLPILLRKTAFTLKSGRKVLDKNIKQAISFDTVFGTKLTADKKEAIDAFIALKQMPFLRRKLTILKYKFLKGKLIQNIGLLLSV